MIRVMLFIIFIGLTALTVASVRLLPTKSSFTSFASNPTNTFVSATTSSTSSPVATSSPIPSPSATPSSTPFSVPTPIPGIANHIVISEVQIAGANVNQDFVELYNPTSTSIDLNGLRLVKRSSGISAVDNTIKSWTSSTIVPANSYYLWANSNNGFATSIGADTSTTDTLSSDNSIAIRQGAENTGVIIDALGWGTSGPNSLREASDFFPNMTASQSAERKAYSTSTASTMNGGADSSKGNGYDLDNNSTDFVLRTVALPQNSGSPIEVP